MPEKSYLKILIADSSESIRDIIQNSLKDSPHQIIYATDGQECLDLLRKQKPNIAFIGLKLSKIHGLDILRAVRSDPETEKISIVISTTKALIQDYQMCIESGVDYYLIKPYDPQTLNNLIAKYQEGQLHPELFSLPTYSQIDPSKFFHSPSEQGRDYIKFWGTRGSVPVSGSAYQTHGGNTSCLEVRSGKHVIIIDAGTGIQDLGKTLMQSDIREIHLIIGHTHWDHIIGFPFFSPAYHADFTINIYAACGFKKSIKELFSGMLDYDYFPVRLDEMEATLNFFELTDHSLQIGDATIHYTFANHPGATLCFKVEIGRHSVGYATDNELFVGYHGHPNEIPNDHVLLKSYQGILDFYRDCDILVHEAQYTSEEYRKKVGWGHSSISNAALLVRYCKPKEWIFTHHDPAHNDDVLQSKLRLHQAVLQQCGIQCHVSKAYDGLKILM